jgi:PAS domain S-box-containing protein
VSNAVVPDIQSTWLWIQLASSLWLAFTLGIVYLRVYRERFLVLWSLSFLLNGFTLILVLTILSTPRTHFGNELLSTMWNAQCVLVAIAALSLSGPFDRRQGVRFFVALLAVAVLVQGAISLLAAPASLDRFLRLERDGLGTLIYVWFTVAFYRRHPLARTLGGLVTLTFLAIYSLGLGAISLTLAGVHIFSNAFSVTNAALAGLPPMGIAAGMVLLGFQAFEVSNRALRESESRHRALVEDSPDAILLTDLDGRIVMCNQRTFDLYDKDKPRSQEFVGRQLIHFVNDSDQERLREHMVHALQGVVREAEYLLERKDGSRFPTEITPSVQRGYDRRPAGFTVFVRDISERRRTEEALHQAQSDLARKARITMMGELAASIAHEINQPLTTVVTNADACRHMLLHRVPDLAELEEAISDIAEAGKRAGAVVSGIRTLLGKEPPQNTELLMGEVIGEALDFVRAEIKKERISVEQEVGRHLRVNGNRVQLQQVMLNLILNSIEAMAPIKKGPKVLRITVESNSSGGVLVAVRDSGVGLDQDIAHIFDSFYTTKPDGLGMGLKISRSIIEAHGGRLWATPNGNGPGTTLRFTLPGAPCLAS